MWLVKRPNSGEEKHLNCATCLNADNEIPQSTIPFCIWLFRNIFVTICDSRAEQKPSLILSLFELLPTPYGHANQTWHDRVERSGMMAETDRLPNGLDRSFLIHSTGWHLIHSNTLYNSDWTFFKTWILYALLHQWTYTDRFEGMSGPVSRFNCIKTARPQPSEPLAGFIASNNRLFSLSLWSVLYSI
jgi:hypothetical protein